MKDIKRIAEELIKIAERLIKIGVEEEEEDEEEKELVDWAEPPELTPEFEEILRQNGFTYEEFLEWFDTFAPAEASEVLSMSSTVKTWKDLVEHFAGWKKEGFGLLDAVAWASAGFTDPYCARIWDEAGFEPGEAEAWVGELKLNIDETGLEEAKKWRKLGLTPKEADELRYEGFDPEILRSFNMYFKDIYDAIEWNRYFDSLTEALDWSDYFDDPEEASVWAYFFKDFPELAYELKSLGIESPSCAKWLYKKLIDLGEIRRFIEYFGSCEKAKKWADFKSLEEAQRWLEYFDDSDIAYKWKKEGFTPEEAKRWYDAGFGPSKAREWKEEGYTPEEVMRRPPRG